jgi:hypothetical protein
MMPTDTKRSIFFVSDHTGLTVEALGHSLMARFEELSVRYETVPFINSTSKARELLQRVNQAALQDGKRPIVFSSITNPEILAILNSANARVLDLFKTYLAELEQELGQASSSRVGRYHGIVDLARYQQRMQAIDFALATDDGIGLSNYQDADIVLVGVSRAGKTPTCLYLGMQYGIRAANYPLADDDFERLALPEELVPFHNQLFGLTIDPLRLQQIRQERKPNSYYASLKQCEFEVKQAEKLFASKGIRFLNVTASSIEEITAGIMQMAGLERG